MDKLLFVTEKQKILISDLLFYVQNKLHTISNDDIVRICANFYDENHIWEQKERFFLAIGKKPIRSRSATPLEKKTKDLNDVLQEMRVRDASGDFQPVCVAIDYSNIPQSEDGSVSNSQILATLQMMRKEFVSFDSMNSALTTLKTELKQSF